MRIFIEIFLFGLEAIVGIKAFGLILTFALNDNYYCFTPALMYTLIFIGLFKLQEFFGKMHKKWEFRRKQRRIGKLNYWKIL